LWYRTSVGSDTKILHRKASARRLFHWREMGEQVSVAAEDGDPSWNSRIGDL
jgi:phage baseplate assembly protein gpV